MMVVVVAQTAAYEEDCGERAFGEGSITALNEHAGT